MQPRPASATWTVDYAFLADQKILVVTTRGAVPSSEWGEISRQATAEGSRHDCLRYLFDHREARLKVRFADLWSLPHNLGAFRLPEGARIALLMRQPLGREKDFMEAFNRNRGFDLKVFDDENQARLWLGRSGESPNPLAFG